MTKDLLWDIADSAESAYKITKVKCESLLFLKAFSFFTNRRKWGFGNSWCHRQQYIHRVLTRMCLPMKKKEPIASITLYTKYVTAGELMKVLLFAYLCIKAIFLKSYLPKTYGNKNVYNSAIFFILVITDVKSFWIYYVS